MMAIVIATKTKQCIDNRYENDDIEILLRSSDNRHPYCMVLRFYTANRSCASINAARKKCNTLKDCVHWHQGIIQRRTGYGSVTSSHSALPYRSGRLCRDCEMWTSVVRGVKRVDIESTRADVHGHSAFRIGIVALPCPRLTSHEMNWELFLHKRHTD